MSNTLLNWDTVSWEDFETLSVLLAQDIFKKPFFEKYLLAGNKQRGIDIRDTNSDTGLPVYLQCKHEKLSAGKLEKLLTAFTSETQWSKPCQFILATTSNLQTEELQNFIDEQKKTLNESLAVEWYIWDVHFLEQQLLQQFRLVQRFFGLEAARRHCLPPGAQVANYQPYTGFITRRVSQAGVFGTPKERFQMQEPRDNYSLMELLTMPGVPVAPICVIADAYEGKSILLEQTAYELSQNDLRLVPLLLRLKNTAIEPIEKLLEATFDGWLSIPAQQLVIIIDGLDEVPTDHFIDVVNHLQAFIHRYGFIRLLFACRKLFYNQYELPKRLATVRFYELEPLSFRQTMQVLEERLGTRADYFYQTVSRLDLEGFLAYPFYLRNLVDWYIEGPSAMPRSKMEVVNRFITESLDTSAQRRLSQGIDLDQRREGFKKLVRDFALALQLAGTNALHQDEMQQLFEQPDLDLLRAGSILTIEDRYWSFNNALYQEQLAALALRDLPAAQIIDVVSIGRKLRKVRLKWIQTLASYLSLLPEEDEGRAIILDLIEQDNIELLTHSDASKFSIEFRLTVFQKIFNKYIQMGVRPILATDVNLGAFSRNDELIISYLLGLLDSDIPESLKVTACRTLSYIRLSRRQAKEYSEVAGRQLGSLVNPYYAELLLDHLALSRLGSPFITGLLFSRAELLQKQEYRDGIYKYLLAHEETDRFYDFGLQGFEVLYLHNKDTSHFGSEAHLQDFLLAGNEPENIKKLFLKLSESSWQEFYQYKAHETTRFMNRLTDLAISVYRRDPTILESVVKFILSLGRNHLKEEFKSIDRFFFETGSNRDALRIYLDLDRQRQYSWELTDLVSTDCFSLLIDQVNSGKLKREDLRSFVNGLYYRGKRAESDALQALIDDTFGKEPIIENSIHDLWQRAEDNRKSNDQRYIQSAELFREGVLKYFEAFGRQEIAEDELYLEPEDKPSLVDVDSYFVQSYLRRCRTEGKRIYLGEVLELLENATDFSFWRAEKLLHYEFRGMPDDDKLREILEEYYQQHIHLAVFENAYFIDDMGQPRRKGREYQLSEIWKKHRFNTSDEILLEMTWMETAGVSGIEHDQLNKQVSLAQLFITHFADRPQLLAERIFNHLKKEISHNSVLASHIGFCKHLKLYEAVPILLDIIISDRFDHYHQYQTIDVYVALDGDKRELLDYLTNFKDYNDYVFIHLVKLLRPRYPNEVAEILLPALNSPGTSTDRKLELAQQLSNNGQFEGFDYIVSQMEQNGVAPLHIQQSTTIWEVDTKPALERLKPVAHMLIDPTFDFHRFWESPKQFMLELLFGFSNKSEEELLMVEAFMHQTADFYQNEFAIQSAHLRWHAERAIDQFRDIQQAGYPIPAIKKILNTAHE